MGKEELVVKKSAAQIEHDRIAVALDALRKFDAKKVGSTESLVRQFRDPQKAHLKDLTCVSLDTNLGLWQATHKSGANNEQLEHAVNELREVVLHQEIF